MWTIMMQQTSAVVGSLIKQSELTLFWWMMHLIWTLNIDVRSHSTEYPFPIAQCMHLVGQQEQIDLPLYMYQLIMEEAWSTHGTSLPYDVFLAKFVMAQGVMISDGEPHTSVSSALNKVTMLRSKGQGGALV